MRDIDCNQNSKRSEAYAELSVLRATVNALYQFPCTELRQSRTQLKTQHQCHTQVQAYILVLANASQFVDVSR
jgi:hypothetical protein